MSTEQPIVLQYEGDGIFAPINGYWARKCDNTFVVGERYNMVEHHERSAASHKQYFAAIRDYWQNLPEDIASKFPTPEHLRKHALIRERYCDKRTIVCQSAKKAEELAAFVYPMDTYAIVATDAATVIVWTAESQAMRAQGKQRFEESKRAVLDFCASLVGAEIDQEQAA